MHTYCLLTYILHISKIYLVVSTNIVKVEKELHRANSASDVR